MNLAALKTGGGQCRHPAAKFRFIPKLPNMPIRAFNDVDQLGRDITTFNNALKMFRQKGQNLAPCHLTRHFSTRSIGHGNENGGIAEFNREMESIPELRRMPFSSQQDSIFIDGANQPVFRPAQNFEIHLRGFPQSLLRIMR